MIKRLFSEKWPGFGETRTSAASGLAAATLPLLFLDLTGNGGELFLRRERIVRRGSLTGGRCDLTVFPHCPHRKPFSGKKYPNFIPIW